MHATRVIEDLRRTGKLKALPIVRVDEGKKTLYSSNGMELEEYGISGTWIPTGELHDGSIRYLGSASHSGHIELKALYVLVDCNWYNIISGESQPHRSNWNANLF